MNNEPSIDYWDSTSKSYRKMVKLNQDFLAEAERKDVRVPMIGAVKS